MPQEETVFEHIVRSRRSMRRFDQELEYDPEIVKKSIELAILSPNSSNMQLWQFYRIRTPSALKKMNDFCLNQGPSRSAREMVVLITRSDLSDRSIKHNLELVNDPSSFEKESFKSKRRLYYSKIMPIYYSRDFLFIGSILKKAIVTLIGLFRPIVREVTSVNKKVTIHKSVALAAQTFMLAVKSYGYDTCPMEGVDSARIKKYLDLPGRAEINMVIAVGKGVKEGVWYPQTRLSYDQVVKEI